MRYSERGTTLIELMIYFALTAIVLTGVSGIALSLFDQQAKTEAIAEVDYNVRMVTNAFARSIRGASGVTSPLPGATSTEVWLTTPFASTSPTHLWLAQGTVYLEIASGTPYRLTAPTVTVTDFALERTGPAAIPTTIRLRLRIATSNPGGRRAYDFQRIVDESATVRMTSFEQP